MTTDTKIDPGRGFVGRLDRADLERAVRVLARLVREDYPPYSLERIANTWDCESTPEDLAALRKIDELLDGDR